MLRNPVIIAGIANRWPALSKWSMDYLETHAGSTQVPVITVPDGKPAGQFFYAGSQRVSNAEFRECLGLLNGEPPRHYMASVPMAQYFKTLYADIDIPELIPDAGKTAACLWVSGAHSTGPLHYDLAENIHAVVLGRKHFLLYDYGESPLLYPKSAFSKFPHMSAVEFDDPDFPRFPRFPEARGYEAILEPGEMIYMPTGCWHRVTTLEPCVAVNFWFGRKWLRRSTLRIVLPALLRLPFDIAMAGYWKMASRPGR